MKRSVDTLKRRPHIRRAVRHGPGRIGRWLELAAGERRDDAELAGIGETRIGEFRQVTMNLDGAIARDTGLQRVTQIQAQLFADARRQIVHEARYIQARGPGLEIEGAAALTF